MSTALSLSENASNRRAGESRARHKPEVTQTRRRPPGRYRMDLAGITMPSARTSSERLQSSKRRPATSCQNDRLLPCRWTKPLRPRNLAGVCSDPPTGSRRNDSASPAFDHSGFRRTFEFPREHGVQCRQINSIPLKGLPEASPRIRIPKTWAGRPRKMQEKPVGSQDHLKPAATGGAE